MIECMETWLELFFKYFKIGLDFLNLLLYYIY